MEKPKQVPMLTLAALAFVPLAPIAQAPPRQKLPSENLPSLVANQSPVRLDNSNLSPEMQVTDMALRLSDLGDTVLPRHYLEEQLADPRVHVLFQKVVRNTIRRFSTIISRPTPLQTRAHIMTAARTLLREMEVAFIKDDCTSTLDLLTHEERDRFRAFAWHENDYPGGPEGPNEDMVLALDEALSRIRPERRANSTSTAVVTKDEFDNAMWAYIQSRRRPVPGHGARQLDIDALVSFLMMREAANRDGVYLTILSSDRLPEVAQRNAERADNPYAVERFSAHILGLAMDMRLSGNVDEVTTRPMSSIICMRSTQNHKWMFLKGATYGWYPYQHEPWHWEYNPPGFRQRFRAGIGMPAPDP